MNSPSESLFRVERTTERQNMQLLIQLRWFAVVGQVITISLVHYGFGINLPLPAMALVLMASVFTNLGYIYWYRSHRRQISARNLFLALLADVLALAIQLYLSGGASNPFIYLFLLQGILGAVLLRPVHAWIIVASTSLCTLVLAIVHWPLPIGAAGPDGLPGLYVSGILISFGLTTVLLVVFLRRIVSNLRRRDARLANMRQRASEEEHIVRMGLLATGAAHELGTPLSTMSVILGDWQRMPVITQDPDLLADLQEMQQQLLRCKSIVSSVLMSAGETRADAPQATTLHAFMDGVVAQWQSRHAVERFDYVQAEEDFPILSDTALQQMVCNVLDNAAEASPGHVALHLSVRTGMLCITVRDKGPGFAPAVLEQLGQRHISTKTERPGRGLGLFLVLNVARSLDGRVQVRNTPPRGSEVEIRLPLSSIAIEPGA
ncbi:ATP-binding protein [Delftia sp. WSY_4]|uniref:ATP-binding protein n=1 Tax=unclassified Delftia TaxID=2613839 RepID=UPI000DB01EBB|nr:MAG: histidine kinase [Delftia acidovorans]